MVESTPKIPIFKLTDIMPDVSYKHKNLHDANAADEKYFMNYVAGLDCTAGGVILSCQFIQEYILDYEEDIYNDEFENTKTFLAKKDFFREKLWAELFSCIVLNNGDALIRSKVTYAFPFGFDIQFAANIFTGTESRFGMYDQNDMLFLKLKYSF